MVETAQGDPLAHLFFPPFYFRFLFLLQVASSSSHFLVDLCQLQLLLSLSYGGAKRMSLELILIGR